MCVLFSFGEWWAKVSSDLSDAGINSIIGLVVVFAVLSLISFIISLFKYISVFEKKKSAKNSVENAGADNSGGGSIGNFELVALLTAAITEYEEAQGHSFKDGMTICSIKKVS